MKKVLLITLLIGLCVFVVHEMFFSDIPDGALSGKIQVRNPWENDFAKIKESYAFIDAETAEIIPSGIPHTLLCFMGNGSKVLINIDNDAVLYDMETKEAISVYTPDEAEGSIIDWEYSYVDEQHFSIAQWSKLILVDIETGEKRVIAEDVGSAVHSWANDGKTVYYSSEGEIVKLNVETGQKTYMFKGSHPQVSKDGELIAYYPDRPNQVIVQELNGENRWKYRAPVMDFCFSPDGKYLACFQWWRGWGLYFGGTLKIADYKTGRTKTVIPKFNAGQCYDIDWVE